MSCDICNGVDFINYRVTNNQVSGWFFVCRECWLEVAKTEGYKYGGTRKEHRRKKFKSN